MCYLEHFPVMTAAKVTPPCSLYSAGTTVQVTYITPYSLCSKPGLYSQHCPKLK